MTFALKPPAFRTPILQSLTTIGNMGAAAMQNKGAVSLENIRPIASNAASAYGVKLVPFIAERMPEGHKGVQRHAISPEDMARQMKDDPALAAAMSIVDLLLPMPKDIYETLAQAEARVHREWVRAGITQAYHLGPPKGVGLDELLRVATEVMNREFRFAADVDVTDVHGRTVTLQAGAQMMVIDVAINKTVNHLQMTLDDGQWNKVTLNFFEYLNMKAQDGVLDVGEAIDGGLLNGGLQVYHRS